MVRLASCYFLAHSTRWGERWKKSADKFGETVSLNFLVVAQEAVFLSVRQVWACEQRGKSALLDYGL